MTTLFKILQSPTKEILSKHSITCFDKIVQKYPADFKKIISYINDCYSYNSEYLVEEKDWGIFLNERFKINRISEGLKDAIINLEDSEIADAIVEYVDIQKQPVFQSLVAKQTLRQQMLLAMTSHATDINKRMDANDAVDQLDEKINLLHEELRQEQKRFGNFKGIDAVKAAKSVNKLNIGSFIK